MDAGRIDIRLDWRDGVIADVRITSSRPAAAAALRGRTTAQVLGLVPALFSICGRAQSLAARAALAVAGPLQGGCAPSGGSGRGGDDVEVATEALREHLWRLLLDWPQLLGQAPQREEFAGWYRRLAACREPAAARVLCASLRDWLLAQGVGEDGSIVALGGGLASRQFDALLHRAPECDADLALLPPLSAAEWCARLPRADAAQFARAPLLRGQPAEAGALARHAEHPALRSLRSQGWGVAARVAARWADCMLLANAVAQDALAPLQLLDACCDDAGRGVARVQTARGTLIHRVQLGEGGAEVADYLVVAPTEWNFHPDGPLARALRGRACDRDEAVGLAQRFALALDPCVAHGVALEEAGD